MAQQTRLASRCLSSCKGSRQLERTHPRTAETGRLKPAPLAHSLTATRQKTSGPLETQVRLLTTTGCSVAQLLKHHGQEVPRQSSADLHAASMQQRHCMNEASVFKTRCQQAIISGTWAAVGSVPMRWYKDEKHIGYDRDAKKIARKARQDRLDALLARNDSGKAFRTIYDEYNDEDIVLSKEELQMVQRIREGRFPHVEVGHSSWLVFWPSLLKPTHIYSTYWAPQDVLSMPSRCTYAAQMDASGTSLAPSSP